MAIDKKILVIGSRGQVARALLGILGDRGIGIGSDQLDLTKTDAIEKFLQNYNPTAIINAAAYTMVDKAEEEREAAETLNALAPEVIAKYCLQKNIPFVHYSTDYVYSGRGSHFMTEEEEYAPLSHYATTKLEGDRRVEAVGGKFLIFRICWVYDANGKNFMNTILRLAGEKKELGIVNDQFGAPTFAGDVARATLDCLAKAMSCGTFPSGIYNLCNEGVTNWHEYAGVIVEKAKSLGVNVVVEKILPLTTAQFVTPAKRPSNSRLSMEKLKSVFDVSLPGWDESLDKVLREKFGKSGG